MNRTLLICALGSGVLHGSIFLTGRGDDAGLEGDTKVAVDLLSEAPPPPPPPPPVESEEADEEATNEPLLSEEFMASGLTEPPPTSIATDAVTQVVRPENVRPPRPDNQSFVIPGRDQRAAGQGAAANIVFSIEDLDKYPAVRFNPAPTYPPTLRTNRVKGSVTLLATVDTSGRVADLILEDATHPEFGESALKTVRRWRFDPGIKDAKPVRFFVRIPITFDPPR